MHGSCLYHNFVVMHAIQRKGKNESCISFWYNFWRLVRFTLQLDGNFMAQIAAWVWKFSSPAFTVASVYAVICVAQKTPSTNRTPAAATAASFICAYCEWKFLWLLFNEVTFYIVLALIKSSSTRQLSLRVQLTFWKKIPLHALETAE